MITKSPGGSLRHLPVALLLSCLISILLSGASALRAQRQQPPRTEVIQSFAEPGEGLAVVRRSTRTGLPTFAAARGQGILLPVAPSVPARDRASRFIEFYGTSFGIGDLTQVALRRSQPPDEIGVEHVRYQQMHRGVPVTAGELIVHLKGARAVGVNAEVLSDLDVDVIPTIVPATAYSAARSVLEKESPVAASLASYSVPQLEVFNRGLLEEGVFPTRLAWFVEATGPDLREFIWIDAHTGVRLLSFSQLTDGRSRSVYTASNGSTLPGTLLRTEGGPAAGDTDADLAYTYAGDTYDYYLAQHGRDSFDNAGATIISTVHYCPDVDHCPYLNAFWNGTQMVYGEGFASADDVVAHELTHAVTEKSANLYYYQQSGALNESFSDIFGETVDLINLQGNDAASQRWTLGEDLSIGAIRNMWDPTLYGDPGKMSDSQFVCSQYTDGGGVHSNSGVPNHAFALMVDGGTYNGQTISGIGLTKVGKIQYRALTVYLTSGSNFLDNDTALKQSCTDLVGTAGITTSDCDQVTKALTAVEMISAWPCSGASAIPSLCPAGQTASTVFSDDFERSTAGSWTVQTLSGSAHWNTTPVTDYAKSGTRAAYGYDRPTIADSAYALTTDVAVPAGGRMQFNHAFSFEASSSGTSFYDGGVVEYSVNGGSSWSDASSLFSAGLGYGGALSSSFGNPLGGRQAFVKTSFGYTATQLDLSSLAGSSVRFRFRIGTDSSQDDLGWLVDDVQIYSCVAGSPAMWIDTPSPGAVVQQPFAVAGWAIDRAPGSGPGVDTVHVWAYPITGGSLGSPVWIGAHYGTSRPDIATAFGDSRFTNSGYQVVASGLTPGAYRIVVYARSTVTGTFNNARQVDITVGSPASDPIMFLDTPVNGGSVTQPFAVAGWAIDRGATSGPGVDTVHVWAYPLTGGALGSPVWVGAQYGTSRPDIGSVFGDSRFTNSGYQVVASGLTPGAYRIVVYARSTVTGTFNNARQVDITVGSPASDPIMFLDTPMNGASVTQPFAVAGWAIDRGATSGPGVDTVHVWAYLLTGGALGSPVWVGAQYGTSRPDIGSVFGDSRFTNSGYQVVASGLTPGAYRIVVYARSTVTGTFNNARQVDITVG